MAELALPLLTGAVCACLTAWAAQQIPEGEDTGGGARPADTGGGSRPARAEQLTLMLSRVTSLRRSDRTGSPSGIAQVRAPSGIVADGGSSVKLGGSIVKVGRSGVKVGGSGVNVGGSGVKVGGSGVNAARHSPCAHLVQLAPALINAIGRPEHTDGGAMPGREAQQLQGAIREALQLVASGLNL